MTTRPPLILVVGMHRSGTSLLGSILEAIGVAMPGPLINGDTHNPEGYFERSDITALQEELLIDLGRWWPSADGLLPLPEGWLKWPRTQRAAAALQRLLQAELPHQQKPWAIKDPRTSLLLPLWRQVASELQLPLRLLLACRDPAEVCTSLVGRDGGPAGMTHDRAQLLWLQHQWQALHDGQGLPLCVVDYGRWFEQPREQLQALASFCNPGTPFDPAREAAALACIRPGHRRSRPSGPGLKRTIQRWKRSLEAAASTGNTKPLERLAQRRPAVSQRPAPNHHPWATALGSLCPGDARSLNAGLAHWEQCGIPALSLEQLAALRHPGFPGEDPSTGDGPLLPSTVQLELIGADTAAWCHHLWIDQLPLPANASVQLHGEGAEVALHLQPLALTASQPQRLLQLSRMQRVFDPDPQQVRLLRLLGVNAEQPAGSGSWLDRSGDRDAAAAQLGLPNPKALSELCGPWLCLGHSDHPAWLHPPAQLLHLPAFPPAPALTAEQGRLLAAWIQACRQEGLQLVRINPGSAEHQLWQHLEVPCFRDPIHPEELLEELAWRQAGAPPPPAIETPQPQANVLWNHDSAIPAAAAIAISSFNYADRLPAALESCRGQSLADLELVIVDDASTDNSVDVCLQWLQHNSERFCRVRLLRHIGNSGLAAARNTAFAASTAPWCFVLDADNSLDAGAVANCLHLAQTAPDQAAVVHPLIRCLNDHDHGSELVGQGHAWQREQLRAGNVVDAMALIRRSAWQEVGGYSHIPGGWEDFDFWCKLIAADYHGVLCPRVLATYRRHGDSMLQSQSNQRQRRLSRLLQHRHPWLQLAMAEADR